MLKIFRLYEHQQETKVPFLAIFGTFIRISSKITLKRLLNFNFIYHNL